MSFQNTQDWTTVTLSKKKTKEEDIKAGNYETVTRKSYTGNKHSTSISTKEANDFENVTPIVKSHLALHQSIKKARESRDCQMTQSELDKACNFPVNTVRNYENGTAIYVSMQVTKMQEVLKVKLPRPPKKKKAKDINLAY